MLVAEAVLGVSVAFTSGFDQTFLVFGMVGCLTALIILVATVSIWHPNALYGRPRPAINVLPYQKAHVQSPIKSSNRIQIVIVDALSDGRQSQDDCEIINRELPLAQVRVFLGATKNDLISAIIKFRPDILQITANVNSAAKFVLQMVTYLRGELLICRGKLDKSDHSVFM